MQRRPLRTLALSTTATLALAAQAGFTRAREAARTPFNIVYELRP